MNRTTTTRGFTLLETLLAATIGAMLMMACLSILSMIDHTDRAAAARARQADMMGRLRLVMERVFSDLVMSEQVSLGTGASSGNRAGGGSGGGTGGGAGGGSGSGGTDGGPGRGNSGATGRSGGMTQGKGGSISGRTGNDEEGPVKTAARNGVAEVEPRPRVMLGADSSSTLKTTMQNLKLGSAATGVQRLEVLVSRTPVPPGFGRSNTVEVLEAMTALPTGPQRGAFELRPDVSTPAAALGDANTVDLNNPGWTLWWRPLPPNVGEQTPDPYAMDPAQDPAAVVIATGLMECQWQAYKTVTDPVTGKSKGREKISEMEASSLQDLPAYFEMSVRTMSGQTAKWMFEVGWSNGPEVLDETTVEDQTTSGEGRSSVSAGGGGGGAGQRARVTQSTGGATRTLQDGSGRGRPTTQMQNGGGTVTRMPGGPR